MLQNYLTLWSLRDNCLPNAGQSVQFLCPLNPIPDSVFQSDFDEAREIYNAHFAPSFKTYFVGQSDFKYGFVVVDHVENVFMLLPSRITVHVEETKLQQSKIE